jgi:hypothetical protein
LTAVKQLCNLSTAGLGSWRRLHHRGRARNPPVGKRLARTRSGAAEEKKSPVGFIGLVEIFLRGKDMEKALAFYHRAWDLRTPDHGSC